MACFKFEVSDARRADGRYGVRIHYVNDKPVRLPPPGEEPMCTAAQAVSVVMVETARRVCEDMGFVIEEVDTAS